MFCTLTVDLISIKIHSFVAINVRHIHSQMSLIISLCFCVCKSACVCVVLLHVHAFLTTYQLHSKPPNVFLPPASDLHSGNLMALYSAQEHIKNH